MSINFYHGHLLICKLLDAVKLKCEGESKKLNLARGVVYSFENTSYLPGDEKML